MLILQINGRDALALSGAMGRIGRALGFHAISFSRYGAGLGAKHPKGLHLGTMPGVWVDHYLASGYAEIDPVAHAAVTAKRPYTWGAVKQGVVTRLARMVLLDAADAGLVDGVVIPLKLPNGRLDVLSAVADHSNFDPDIIELLELLADAVRTLSEDFVPDPRRGRDLEPLTARERQVLQLVLIGKTNKEIGQLLGASEHTIARHIASVLGKWPAANRRAAAYLAARYGLIDM